MVALIAVLQTLRFPPVTALLDTLWNSGANAANPDELGDRGSATLGSPIATGDVVDDPLTGQRWLVVVRPDMVLALVGPSMVVDVTPSRAARGTGEGDSA